MNDGGSLIVEEGIAYGKPDWPAEKVSSVRVGSNGTVILPADCRETFAGLANTDTVRFEDVDGSFVSDASRMFADCGADDIDLGALSLPNANDASYMFAGCGNIPFLDLSDLGDIPAASTEGMFYGCYKLKSVVLPEFSGGNLRTAAGMFERCPSIRRIRGLSGIDTSNATDCSRMFDGCMRLRDLAGAEEWDLSSCRTTAGMFLGCFELDSVPVENWNPLSLESAEKMFASCSKLKTFDLSEWKTPVLRDTTRMFLKCGELVQVIPPDRAISTPIIAASDMFAQCISLETIDLEGWNFGPHCDADAMFHFCTNLKEVIGAEAVERSEKVFFGCRQLTSKTARTGAQFTPTPVSTSRPHAL